MIGFSTEKHHLLSTEDEQDETEAMIVVARLTDDEVLRDDEKNLMLTADYQPEFEIGV